LEACLVEAPASDQAAQSLTVVMPVFNALPYLDQAIASIAAQTHSDFQLAIYDDHSNDGSYELALAWASRDPRISVVRGDRRLGPCGSSAAAAALATGQFVARMDADDIATPDRLAVQLRALLDDPTAVLVGSVFDMIDGENRLLRPAAFGQIRTTLPPIAHASILYRRAAFEAAGGYRSETDYFEDQDFYARISKIGRMLVIDRPLIKLRFAGQHARLRDDRSHVLELISRHYRPAERNSAGASGGLLEPLAFYSVGVLAVMGLERPRLLGLMIRRGNFSPPFAALAVLAFIAVAEVSPRLARGLNYLIGRLRAQWIDHRHAVHSVRVWQFEQG
jgi:glycosyltransferase involved in cell wall biosynthesis